MSETYVLFVGVVPPEGNFPAQIAGLFGGALTPNEFFMPTGEFGAYAILHGVYSSEEEYKSEMAKLMAEMPTPEDRIMYAAKYWEAARDVHAKIREQFPYEDEEPVVEDLN